MPMPVRILLHCQDKIGNVIGIFGLFLGVFFLLELDIIQAHKDGCIPVDYIIHKKKDRWDSFIW